MRNRIRRIGVFLIAAALLLGVPSFSATGLLRTAAAAENGMIYRVRVDSGYLALRSSKAYTSENEIGRLYTGDLVEIIDGSGSQYWHVYSSTLGKTGYVNCDYLDYYSSSSTLVYGVSVSKGYLALRSAKAYDSKNEIGKLYNGDTVEIKDDSDSQYWYVYSRKLGKSGYVNCDYLYYISGNNSMYTVSVKEGYLALRSAEAYDSRNEIGKLYSGDTVRLEEKSSSQYWYVYSPTLAKYGYVNKDYLVKSSSRSTAYPTRTVKVSKGYLALRSDSTYDSKNEIGRLYTGDTVEVRESGNTQYWYVYAPSLGKTGYVNKDYLY